MTAVAIINTFILCIVCRVSFIHVLRRARVPCGVFNRHSSHHSHHGLGGYSKLINELRAAASGAFAC